MKRALEEQYGGEEEVYTHMNTGSPKSAFYFY